MTNFLESDFFANASFVVTFITIWGVLYIALPAVFYHPPKEQAVGDKEQVFLSMKETAWSRFWNNVLAKGALSLILTAIILVGVYQLTPLPRPAFATAILSNGSLTGTWYGPLTASAADGVAGTAEVVITIQQHSDGRLVGTGSTCDPVNKELLGQYQDFQVSGSKNGAAISLAFSGTDILHDPSIPSNTDTLPLAIGMQGTIANGKMSLSGSLTGSGGDISVNGNGSVLLQPGTQSDFTSACASLLAVLT